MLDLLIRENCRNIAEIDGILKHGMDPGAILRGKGIGYKPYPGFLFIDGGRGYETCRNDFDQMY